MRILHLTLKKIWFDDIITGVKKEEYREIKKHWCSRLVISEFAWDISKLLIHLNACPNGFFKKYDMVRFTNGYGKDAPTMDVEITGISIGLGLSKWGAPLDDVFVISLGKILSTKNLKP